MTKFFLEANSDSWWLSFSIVDSIADDAVTLNAPRGTPGPSSDINSFSIEIKRSDSIDGWNFRPGVVDAHYTPESGFVDVPIVAPFVTADDGVRLHFILWKQSPLTAVAQGEIVWVRDLSRQEDGLICESDKFLSFRIADGQVESSYMGPTAMSGLGSQNTYALRTRVKGLGTNWGAGTQVRYDQRTGIADCLVEGIAMPDETIEYRLTPYSSDSTIYAGEMAYSEDCAVDGGGGDGNRYYITTDGSAEALLFRLANYEPDISDAIVVSVTTTDELDGSADQISGFTFRYIVNGEGAWLEKSCTYIEEAGVLQVSLDGVMSQGVSYIDFKLVFDD